MKKLYSAGQVLGGSYLGGPFAAIYFLKKDFETLGKPETGKNVLIFGIIGTVILIPILLFIPENFPDSAIGLSYSCAAWSFALQNNLRRTEIQAAGIYECHSNWRVIGIALIGIAAFLIVAIPSIIGLGILFEHAGLIKPSLED
jgi:hypothetical protein